MELNLPALWMSKMEAREEHASAASAVRQNVLARVTAIQKPRPLFVWLRRGFALAGVVVFAIVIANLWRLPEPPPAPTAAFR